MDLPPLNNLLAFEAVARRGSFALAAGELNLTPSAVSHQIARLEGFLGARLFDRSAAGVKLSPAGAQYLDRVGGVLGALDAATTDLRRGPRNSLHVHCSPSFASLWLMPRLPHFALAWPQVSLSLSASPTHSDFALGQADVDVRYGRPNWPSLVVQPLFEERVLPLASPALIAHLGLHEPAELVAHDATTSATHAPLIQSTVSLVQWPDWLAAQGVAAALPRFAWRFDRAQLALDAAVQGLGIALESATMASTHLAAGRLAPVFAPTRALRVQGHHLVYPAHHARRDEVQAFGEWLAAQARASPDALSGAA